MVRDVETGELTSYRVWAESQPVYCACEIDIPEVSDE